MKNRATEEESLFKICLDYIQGTVSQLAFHCCQRHTRTRMKQQRAQSLPPLLMNRLLSHWGFLPLYGSLSPPAASTPSITPYSPSPIHPLSAASPSSVSKFDMCHSRKPMHAVNVRKQGCKWCETLSFTNKKVKSSHLFDYNHLF